MKKIMAIAAVAAIAAGIAINSITSVTAAPAQIVEEKGYVSASASADKELTPDTVEISVSVVTYDTKSLQEATAKNKEISENVYAALKGMINTANKDYIKTSNFSANPQYTYNNGKKRLDKYRVSNSIIIHTKSIEKVGDMIDKAISLGATDVNNMNFSVSEYENECNALLANAGKKARSQADALIKSVGSEITGVKSLSGSCNSSGNNTRYRYNMLAKSMNSMDMAEGAAEPATPIEAGVVKIYANVNASFFVK